jgi:hypothetical protein
MSFLAANRRELRRANFKNQVGKHLAAFYACELPIVANEQESTSPLGKRSKKRKSFRIDHGRLVKHEEGSIRLTRDGANHGGSQQAAPRAD